MTLPIALVTNDDGIDSWFLTRMIDGLRAHFDLRVVAPHHEQSWSGRSFTREGRLRIHHHPDRPYPCWSVEGTPTDCVNIALGNILDQKPQIVISGINMGFNIGLPLALTSGTLAAALEGALWGLPALAASLALPREWYARVKETGGNAGAAVDTALDHATTHICRLAPALLDQVPGRTIVHSLNFPFSVTADTPVEGTRLGRLQLGGMFEKVGEDEVAFRFPRKRPEVEPDEQADFAVIRRDHISHTVLDYDRLSIIEDG